MIIAYSSNALADLDDIAAYLDPRNPAAARRIAMAIRSIIDGLSAHPKRGRRQDSQAVRKVVEPKYGYLIYYHLDEAAASITILSIRHHSRARPFDDA